MKAHELLADRSKWTHTSYARDSYKSATASGARDAVCWCALGAIFKCYKGSQAHDMINKVAIRISGSCSDAERVVANANDINGYEYIFGILTELDI